MLREHTQFSWTSKAAAKSCSEFGASLRRLAPRAAAPWLLRACKYKLRGQSPKWHHWQLLIVESLLTDCQKERRGWGARVSFLQQNRHLGADSSYTCVNNPIDSNFQELGFSQVRAFLWKKTRNRLHQLTLDKVQTWRESLQCQHAPWSCLPTCLQSASEFDDSQIWILVLSCVA